MCVWICCSYFYFGETIVVVVVLPKLGFFYLIFPFSDFQFKKRMTNRHTEHIMYSKEQPKKKINLIFVSRFNIFFCFFCKRVDSKRFFSIYFSWIFANVPSLIFHFSKFIVRIRYFLGFNSDHFGVIARLLVFDQSFFFEWSQECKGVQREMKGRNNWRRKKEIKRRKPNFLFNFIIRFFFCIFCRHSIYHLQMKEFETWVCALSCSNRTTKNFLFWNKTKTHSTLY